MSIEARPTNVRWSVLAIVMAFSFVNQFNRVSMSVAGDLRIMDQYGLSTVAMGGVYSAFLLGYTLLMTPGGWVIDRLGTRRTLALMGFGSALFGALTGVSGWIFAAAGSLWWALAIIRGLMGGFSPPIYPAGADVARRWFPPGRRALANGLITGASPLGIAVTYVGFGALVRRFDWPSAFVITGAVTAALAALWARYAADRPEEHPGTNEAERALAHEGESAEETAPVDGGWTSLLADRGLMLLTASYAAVGYFDFLFFYWMNHYFTKELKLGDAAQWYASLPPLAMAVGIPLGGWLSDRLARTSGPGARAWVAVGGMVASAGLLFLGVRATDPLQIVAWFALALGAIGMSESTFWVAAVERGGRRGGTAAGIMNTGGNLGGVVAPVLTPWVGLRYGWPAAIALGGLIGLLGAACWLGIRPSAPAGGRDGRRDDPLTGRRLRSRRRPPEKSGPSPFSRSTRRWDRVQWTARGRPVYGPVGRVKQGATPMNRSGISRRGFLAASGGGLILGAGARGNPPGPRPQTPDLRVRQNIADLSDAQLASLKRGVAAMMARPVDDPTSWQFQANIHGTDGPVSSPLWNRCQHGTPLFFAWHRGYLYFFERILRKASGDDTLTLPYWDWSASPAVPVAYRDPADDSNPLFHDRDRNDGALIPPQYVVDDLDTALAQVDFGWFSPSLEGSPHGTVHTTVGGDMASVPTSARDPLFWLHHCNIDRTWNRWQNLADGRRNPVDAGWLGVQYSYADENGQTQTVRVADIVGSAALGYVYDNVPNPAPPSMAPMHVANLAVAGGHPAAGGGHPATPPAAAGTVAATSVAAGGPADVAALPAKPLGFAPATIHLEPAPPSAAPLHNAVMAAHATRPGRLLIDLHGLTVAAPPKFGYDVYLNLPAGEVAPDRLRMHRVGSVNFFGKGPGAGPRARLAHVRPDPRRHRHSRPPSRARGVGPEAHHGDAPAGDGRRPRRPGGRRPRPRRRLGRRREDHLQGA